MGEGFSPRGSAATRAVKCRRRVLKMYDVAYRGQQTDCQRLPGKFRGALRKTTEIPEEAGFPR